MNERLSMFGLPIQNLTFGDWGAFSKFVEEESN